jgi:transposase-like protein
LTVFAYPKQRQCRLRTSNLSERINRELKRRTRVVSLFPNPASLERLVTAVLMEIDEDWQSAARYLPMTYTRFSRGANLQKKGCTIALRVNSGPLSTTIICGFCVVGNASTIE